MNTQQIKIGNCIYSIGDTFPDNESIHWTDESQAFKAQNLTDKEITLFVANKFYEQDCKNIQDYFSTFTSLSTRSGSPIRKFVEQMTDSFYLFDTLAIKTPCNFNEEHYPYIAYKNGKNEMCTNKLKTNGTTMYITIHDLTLENGTLIEYPIQLYYKGSKKNHLISKSLQIIILSDSSTPPQL